ncbi:MAG: hypothetical protein K2O84_09815 [Oscillospiraceae bacterium]|nr:hypothetical protein [Oscillospiraceae bacterium]
MAEKPFENPLPADLPENWTAGQIVAPTGEEVGLSHQHGYNYLMEMVNRAHRGVNAVGAVIAGGIGGGFIEMEQSIPIGERKKDTLYGLILQEYVQ